MDLVRRRAALGAGAAAWATHGGKRAEAKQDWMRVSTPEPVRYPRKRLNEAFAVLLMRAAYESVDELGFVSMDAFQKAFWLQRRSEQEAYLQQHAPLRVDVGQLSDPLYFDYISYAQWQTIDRQLRRGRAVFQEKQGADDATKTTVPNDASLPSALHRSVGDKILHGLQEGYQDDTFDGPARLDRVSSRPEDVMVGVKKILQVFVDRGFCLQCVVDDVVLSEDDVEASQYHVRVEGAANAWAVQALQSHDAKVRNYYDALVVDAYMRQCGRSATYDVRPRTSTIHETWRFA
mmetsp:Transcript_10717/g.66051  ORF Transcript_10717/g.66051 Transcript_10717/m.66051 type:complete len:291 (-) Transcript_10717:721-1593(-)